MIKSIALTENGMTCYKTDGSILNLPLKVMPEMNDIMKMMQNIQLNGCTELLGLKTDSLMSLISEMGFEPVKQEGGIFIKLSNGPIPAEPLQDLIKHSHATGNSAALQALMNRISTIDRQHSVEDLVRFIENAEMPVTADGRLVAFKRVNKHSDGNNYDVYSGTILNNVGCRVQMDIENVDPNRARDCSYGLHVASRGYLRNFSGDTLLLILVNPEDVIAVPQYDPKKVRVCRYDIVHEFTPEDMNHILSWDPLNNFVWSIIHNFMKGTTYAINQIVQCGKHGMVPQATNTEVVSSQASESVSEDYYKEIKSSRNEKGSKEAAVKAIKQVKSMNKFRDLYNLFEKAEGWADQKSRFADLQIYKRKQKKSWQALGATDEEAKKLNKFAERVK